MNCSINCFTLKCKVCNKSVSSCDVKRNCNGPTDKNGGPVGPGTELKKLLFRIGIDATSGCKCADRAKHMDYMESVEPGWAEKNIEEIVDWMEEEAKKRKLPFLRAGAKLLVKLAIRRAKK